MCQHCCFWLSRTSTGELQVGDVVRADYAVKDVEDMFWDVVRIINKG